MGSLKSASLNTFADYVIAKLSGQKMDIETVKIYDKWCACRETIKSLTYQPVRHAGQIIDKPSIEDKTKLNFYEVENGLRSGLIKTNVFEEKINALTNVVAVYESVPLLLKPFAPKFAKISRKEYKFSKSSLTFLKNNYFIVGEDRVKDCIDNYQKYYDTLVEKLDFPNKIKELVENEPGSAALKIFFLYNDDLGVVAELLKKPEFIEKLMENVRTRTLLEDAQEKAKAKEKEDNWNGIYEELN